jgi:hypothetical protein
MLPLCETVALDGAEIVNVGTPTVSVMVVLAVIDPHVPVTVIVYVPGAAVLLAVRVIWLLYVVEFGEKDAVTPAGSPEADSATLPLKPY